MTNCVLISKGWLRSLIVATASALLAALAGCGGGSSGSSSSSSGTFGMVVPNSNGTSVNNYVFALTDRNDTDQAPSYQIAGGSTGLDSPEGVSVDSNSQIYVADCGTSSISIFAPLPPGSGAQDVAPVSTIAGANTTLNCPVGIVVATGNILPGYVFVADNNTASIVIFAPPFIAGTNNVAPIATITGALTTLSAPFGITLDSSSNIYVTDETADEVAVFSPKLNPGLNNVAPTSTIVGATTTLQTPLGITLDSQNNIYVADEFVGLDIFSPPAAGANDVAPLSTIVPLSAGFDLTGVQVDPGNDIDLADFAHNAIYHYAQPAGGTTSPTPIATLTGVDTLLEGPELFALATN